MSSPPEADIANIIKWLDILKWTVGTSLILWIPFLNNLYKKFCPQKVYVKFDKKITLGFNENGSFAHVRLAICAPKSDDIIFEKLYAKLKFDNTSEFDLQTTSIEDSITTKLVNTSSNESISAVRTRPDILILLKSGYVTDKDVMFNESTTEIKLKECKDKYNEKKYHVLKADPYNSDNLINSQEFKKLINEINSTFIWRSGKYIVTFLANSENKKITLKNNKFSFELTAEDVSQLDKNKQVVENVLRINPQNDNQKQFFVFKEIKYL